MFPQSPKNECLGFSPFVSDSIGLGNSNSLNGQKNSLKFIS